MEREFISVPKFAAIFGFSKAMVYRMVHSGKIKALTHPKMQIIRIPIEEIDRLKAELQSVEGPIRASRR